MIPPLRLVVFDVDGTLVDSRAAIGQAMDAAFAEAGLPAPDRDAVLSVVGLSLDMVMAVLAPDLPETRRGELVAAYRRAYSAHRVASGAQAAPLYPGAREVLRQLAARPDVIVGVATGKSRRGLEALIEAHGIEGVFVTRQVADDHPSKPHPSMLLAAMEEVGADPAGTVMVGDTSFDMDMARAAQVPGIGVAWGYHPVTELRSAHCVIDDFGQLAEALERIWNGNA